MGSMGLRRDIADLLDSGRLTPPLDQDLMRFCRMLADRLGTTVAEPGHGRPDALVASEGKVVLVTVPLEPERRLADVLAPHAAGLRRAAAVVLDVAVAEPGNPAVHRVAGDLATIGVTASFVGRAMDGASTHVIVVAIAGLQATNEAAPESFRVAALMTAYNEADIIRPTVERLLEQGIDVYLLDNWSEDGTPDLVRDLLGQGLLAIEQYPTGGRNDRYDWSGLLRRIGDVAASLDHDWCVHHDVDERRDGPWPDATYRDALYRADRSGFNAVDHTIFEFRPTDDDFMPGSEVSEHLRHFELTPGGRFSVNVKAWRNDQPVDLVSSGGHDATFPGRRVFPVNFTLRHYPARSQAHGERKVFGERLPRYPSDELVKGWHSHYARLDRAHRFVRDPEELQPYRPATFGADFLLPRLGRVAMPQRGSGRREAVKAVSIAGLRRLGLLEQAAALADRWRSR